MTTPTTKPGLNQQAANTPSVAEALAALPTLGAATTKHPIGVPDGYLAQPLPGVIGGSTGDMDRGYSSASPQPLPPRYFDGDEYEPANLPPDQIAEKQRSLVDAGLMTEAEYHAEMGSWSAKSISAYQQLLQNANATGQTEDVALATFKATAAANPRPKTNLPQPLVVHQTNPDDIRDLANAVAVRTLGKRLSEGQLQAHVASWQQTERAAQEEQYKQTGSGSQTDPGTGGTILDPAKSISEETIRNENPQDAASYDAVQRQSQFEQLLRSH